MHNKSVRFQGILGISDEAARTKWEIFWNHSENPTEKSSSFLIGRDNHAMVVASASEKSRNILS